MFRLPTRSAQEIVPCMMSTTRQAHQSGLVSMFGLSGIGDVKFHVESCGGVCRGVNTQFIDKHREDPILLG